MAAYYPQTPERLLDIFGVGQVKAHQYGDPFLATIRDYCGEHGISERQKEGHRSRGSRERRYVSIGKAFNNGESVESLETKYGVQTGTILNHLTRYAAAGHKLRPTNDLFTLTSASVDQQTVIFAAFDELGTTYLKPVFDRLDGQVSYDELKVLRLCYLTRPGQ